MSPITTEISKAIIAKYDSSQLLKNREMVSLNIKKELLARLRPFHINVDEVSLTQLYFSKEYEKAIEEKQIAQQKAERMKYVVEKAKQIKKTSIIMAEADCKSIELIGKAVQGNPSYITLQKIEYAKEISEILSKSQNMVLLDSNQLLINTL